MASSCQREPIASRILSLFNRNASGSKVGDILPVVASTFFDVPNGMMYAWNVFRPFFSFSLSLSLSPILELTTSFFLSESFLFLKYKSMLTMFVHHVLLYIFCKRRNYRFLLEEEISFVSRLSFYSVVGGLRSKVFFSMKTNENRRFISSRGK